MEDESAEIELLEQNLNKTRQISQRMTTLLSSFDNRLNKLEKAITPLYKSMNMLDRRSSNIDKALSKIDEIISNQEGVAAEEAMILRGPQDGQLDVYTDALTRLNVSISFKLSEANPDSVHLFEAGVKKLSQTYTKLVAEASSAPAPIGGGSEFQQAPFPQDIMEELTPLVTFLRGLPLPATHPNHPSSTIISSVLKEAQKGYSDMRGTWNSKALEVYGKRLLDRAETIDSMVSGAEFGIWVANLIEIGEYEYELLEILAPLPSASSKASAFSVLSNSLLHLFSTIFTTLTNMIRKSLHKHNFLALSAYHEMLHIQPQWEAMLAHRSAREVDEDGYGGSGDEMKDGLNKLRAVVLRSFPEVLADIKVGAVPNRTGELRLDPPEFMLVAITYLERLPQVKDAVAPALLMLGDGNWRMGQDIRAVKSRLGEGDESIVLEHFTFDVVNGVIQSLTALSKTSPRPGFGPIFLLNNISYLRTFVLDSPNPDLASILPRQTTDILNSNFRIAKAGYYESTFMPLISTLGDDPRDRGKIPVKDKYVKFFDLLEIVKERHLMYKVLPGEELEDEKEALAEEVVKLVITSLQRFNTKNRESGKNVSKYNKMSPDEVEKMIRALY